jgi:hypothetical protein
MKLANSSYFLGKGFRYLTKTGTVFVAKTIEKNKSLWF